MVKTLFGLLTALATFTVSSSAALAQAQNAPAQERTVLASTGGAAAPFALKLRPPRHGIYHAAFPAFGPAEDTVTRQHIDRFSNDISGKDLTWAYFSDNW